MKNNLVALCVFGIVASVVGCGEEKAITASASDGDIFGSSDLGKNTEDAVGNEDVLVPEVVISSVHDGYIGCGDVGSCLLNFVCVDNNICCPNSLPQECGGQCFPTDCQCVEDGEFVLCLPDNMEYCGNGVSCPEGECYQDGENYYCVSEDQEYCGAGVVCNLNEVCHEDGDIFYCAPNGYIYCFGQDRWCKDSEICTENSCCPKVQPTECGQTCCYPDEPCVDAAKSVCLPKDGQYCDGAICVAGETCMPNGLADCLAETSEICDNGMVCPPGSVCSIGEEGDCCPQGQPQRCGNICCPENFTCMETDFGKKCVYPGAEPCGDGECAPGEFCADEIFGICAEDGSEPCDDGHICEPGTYCAGPTCCSYINGNQNCNMLCCPSNWTCEEDGLGCTPPGAQYLGNGKYCGVGTKFNEENGNCDPIGWEPCGTGPACKPGTTCSKEGSAKQCCPADQETLCGDKCCFSGFQCFHDGPKNVCIPPGADYCWGQNINEWCSSGKTCGNNGKNCIPVGAMECENGDFCSVSEKCTESEPACCQWATPVPCEAQCCLQSQKCETVNSVKQCIPKDAEVCPANPSSGVFEDTMCYNETFCAPDNYCVSDKKKLDNYCGGGNGCKVFEPAMHCGGICSDFCCSQFNIACAENCSGDSCCFPLSVGCLNSCMPAWSVCAAFPLSNSPTAYLNPKEGYYGPFLDGKWLSKNISKDGIYHVEWDSGNWIIGNKGDVILVVEAVWVIDNLETQNCKIFDPHGPFGKLYLRVHSLDTFPQLNKIHIDWVTKKLYEYNLRGSHAGPCPCQVCIDYLIGEACKCISDPVTDEWLDNQFLRYSTGKAGVYKWGENEEAIYLSIIEGDYSNSDDIGGVELISKEETATPCGKWVPFYKYETISCSGLLCLDVQPKWPKKTDAIAAFLLLRTITCTGKPGDPCQFNQNKKRRTLSSLFLV